jgi:hypothetical protein
MTVDTAAEPGSVLEMALAAGDPLGSVMVALLTLLSNVAAFEVSVPLTAGAAEV